MKCKNCGKSLSYKADKCGYCAKKSLQKIFAENPEVKQAFKESIEEMRKPDNVKKMVDDTYSFVERLKSLHRTSTK